MKRHLLVLALFAPFLAAGLWLWRDQGSMIALADFIAWCF